MLRVTGLEQVNRNLEKQVEEIKHTAEAASGNVPLTELMPSEFIQAHTQFESLQAMVDAAGITNSAEELKGEA